MFSDFSINLVPISKVPWVTVVYAVAFARVQIPDESSDYFAIALYVGRECQLNKSQVVNRQSLNKFASANLFNCKLSSKKLGHLELLVALSFDANLSSNVYSF